MSLAVLFVDREESAEHIKEGPDQVQVTHSDKESVKVVQADIANHALTWVQLHAGGTIEKEDEKEQKVIKHTCTLTIKNRQTLKFNIKTFFDNVLILYQFHHL